MAMQIRPTQSSSEDEAPKGSESADNRLALLDQAFYRGHQTVGQKEVMQVVWVYERPVDMEALRRFHRHLGYGLLGRRIERSPLPFGRYRWVSGGRSADLDVTERPRPRVEFGKWLDERAQFPLDPETGPGWRLSVCPFTDGATAVTLVMSHYVIDGIGGVVAVVMAILGDTRGYGYPPARSRPLVRALAEDFRDAVREIPAVTKATITAVGTLRQARQRGQEPPRPPISRPVPAQTTEPDEPAGIPGIWIRTAMDEWEARAAELGGTGSTLATALTAKIGERMGLQRTEDGAVRTVLVVNDRTEGDTRAVAVSFAQVTIDPTAVTSDLRGVRATVKQALKDLRESDDPSTQLAPLTPFMPKRAWRAMIENGLDEASEVAVCSSLGEVGPVVIRPDGTPCDYAFLRGLDQRLTRQRLERIGNQLQLFYGCGAEANKVGLHVRAYHSKSVTTRHELHELVENALVEFGLVGEID